MQEDDNINFVTQHYSEGKFCIDKGWKRLRIVRFWNWKRVSAAASVGIIVISAAAFVAYNEYRTRQSVPQDSIEVHKKVPAITVKTIDFEDASLPTVVMSIESVYDVSVCNMPENAEDYKLSLHYEGTAYDLVETINDILGTQLTVEQK